MNQPMPMPEQPSLPVRRSVSEKLTQEKLELEARLEEINEALSALQSNPGIEHVLNLVTKASDRYY